MRDFPFFYSFMLSFCDTFIIYARFSFMDSFCDTFIIYARFSFMDSFRDTFIIYARFPSCILLGIPALFMRVFPLIFL